jgi:ribosomal protein S3AE
MRPNYLLVLPWQFRKELLERGRETIRAGTKLIFPLPAVELPAVEIVSNENYETAARASASAQAGVQGLLFGEVLPTR